MTNIERARTWLTGVGSLHRFDDRAASLASMLDDAERRGTETIRKRVEFIGLRGTCPGCAAEDPDRYQDANPHSDGCMLAPRQVVASAAPPLRPREG